MTPDELKAWRARVSLSQSQLAHALNVHTMTISKWERGSGGIPPFLDLALESLERRRRTARTARRAS